jgi:hypothetical protein
VDARRDDLVKSVLRRGRWPCDPPRAHRDTAALLVLALRATIIAYGSEAGQTMYHSEHRMAPSLDALVHALAYLLREGPAPPLFDGTRVKR